MEINEIVTELYSLRAGLSLIAKEKDLLDKEQAAAEEDKDRKIAKARSIADGKIAQAQLEESVARSGYGGKSVSYEYDKAAAAAAKVKKEVDLRREEIRELDEYFERRHKDKADKIIMAFRLIFGILFVSFYLASAGLSYHNIYFLDFKGYIFLLLLIGSLGIAITELVWLYNYFNYSDDEFTAKVIFIKIFVGIIYFFHSVFYFALMLIAYFGEPVNSAILIVIAVAAAVGTITTTVFTIIYFRDDNATKYYKAQKEKYRIIQAELPALEEEYSRLNAEEKRLRKINNKYNREKEIKFSKIEREYEEKMQKAEEEYDGACNSGKEQCKSICAASAELHNGIATEIWNSLVNNYDKLLDVRDWQILDLVIWQVETGRADSVKEALQLADRETQTNRIVGAIKYASEAVMQRIQIGFGSLRAQLNNNFDDLSRSFSLTASGISSKINQSIKEINLSLHENQTSNMLAMERSFEQIVSQASLQTALLEKANTSSGNLISAVNELRESQKKYFDS